MTEDLLSAPSRSHLTGAQTVRLGNFIMNHCRPAGQVPGEACFYEEGWSDQRIVDEFHEGVTLNNVTNLRTQLLGKLVDPPAVVQDPRVDNVIVTINAILAALCGDGNLMADTKDDLERLKYKTE